LGFINKDKGRANGCFWMQLFCWRTSPPISSPAANAMPYKPLYSLYIAPIAGADSDEPALA